MRSTSSLITAWFGPSRQLAGGALFIALVVSACADDPAARTPTIHRPGPAGQGYFGTLTPRQLALGDSDGLGPSAPRRPVDIDAYLKPSEPRPARKVERRTVALTPPAVRETTRAPEPEALASLAPTAKPPAPATNDAQRYAARERQNSKQMQYRGGDVIVISVTTLLVILLIVLIVLLLT